jgi:cytochrome P450
MIAGGVPQMSSYNPFDPDQVDDHDRLTEELRQSNPVSAFAPGAFFLARYRDVSRVAHAADTFRQGGVAPLGDDPRSADQKALFETDPPTHKPLRHGFVSALSPRRIASCEGVVRVVCANLVEALVDQPTVDLVAQLGVPLPARVVARLTGFRDSEWRDIRAYCDDFVSGVAAPDSEEGQDAVGRCADFEDMLRDRIRRRRAAIDRPDDLLTALIESRGADGEPVSDERVLTHLSKDILIGGLETTTHLVGNLFVQILSTPGLYERLRANPSLIPQTVEESLRHMSPVQIALRRASRDATVDGVRIEEGSVLILGLASANRDESEFPHAASFDIDRGAALSRHVAFDRGIHSCVGAPLVRMEAKEALRTVLEKFAGMELAEGFSYRRVRHFMMRGPVAVPVAVT